MNDCVLILKIYNEINHNIKFIIINDNAEFFYKTVNTFYNNSFTKKFDDEHKIIDYKLVNLNAIFDLMGVNIKIDFNETEILVLNGILGQYSDFIKDNKDKILDTAKIDPDTYCKIINNLKSKLFANVLFL